MDVPGLIDRPGDVGAVLAGVLGKGVHAAAELVEEIEVECDARAARAPVGPRARA
jgi:hypothetical protein